MEYKEYWDEVRDVADTVVKQAMEDNDNDIEDAMDDGSDLVHQFAKDHQWIIYYGENLDVIRHTDNEDYYLDTIGTEALAKELEGGLKALHCAVAFWAFYADISFWVYVQFSALESEAA